MMAFLNAALNRAQDDESGPELGASVGVLVAACWAIAGMYG